MANQITHSDQSRLAILRGVKQLAEAVKVTQIGQPQPKISRTGRRLAFTALAGV